MKRIIAGIRNNLAASKAVKPHIANGMVWRSEEAEIQSNKKKAEEKK